jgi:hypothetical protein
MDDLTLMIFLTIYSDFCSFARECDGLISVSSAAYDQKSLEALRVWFKETNRPVYAIGPLVPPGLGDTGLSDTAKQMEINSSNNGSDVQAFLDRILNSHGKQSLIYVNHLHVNCNQKSACNLAL